MKTKAINPAQAECDLERYPTTAIEEQLSIFCVPLHHGIVGAHLSKTAWWDNRAKNFDQIGWRLHPYNFKGDRFRPEQIFTADALKIHFGDNTNTPGSSQITGDYLRNKLHPWEPKQENDDSKGLVESLFFTLDPSRFAGTWSIFDHGVEYSFTIRWVDLLLFNDGLGILAINTKLSPNGVIDICRLSGFHRMFRCLPEVESEAGQSTPGIPYRLGTAPVGGDILYHGHNFWVEVVRDIWLVKGTILSPIKNPNHWRTTPAGSHIYIANQRYAKILALVQNSISEEDKRLWERPFFPPAELFSEKERTDISTGTWPSPSPPLIQSRINGVPTIRDVYAFELATLSDQYASVGWQETGREWQYSYDYHHNIVSKNCVKIWEYWTCVALRDTCVFVAFDNKMPIAWQTESRYYALYLAVYHLRLRLEQLGSDIIEYDMADVWHGREIKDQMIRFRNHYRFKEMTKDFVGVEVFNKMKAGMSVDDLYEQVNTEVQDVSDHLQQKWARSSRILLGLLVIFLKPIEKGWDLLLNSQAFKNIWASASTWLLDPAYHLLAIPLIILFLCFIIWWIYPTFTQCCRSLFKLFRRMVAQSEKYRDL